MTALAKAIAKGYKATHDGVTKLYRKVTGKFDMTSNELIVSGDDILQFKPQGLNPDQIPQSLYNDMLSKYRPLLSDAKKKEFLDNLIKSGSDVLVKNIVN